MLQRQAPQAIFDLYQEWGNDLQLVASNQQQTGPLTTYDLRVATSDDLSNQRILRRLITVAPNYIWQPDYGAGVPAFVGQALSSDLFDQIKSLINSQIFLESTVAQNPAPVISLQTIQGGLYCSINYTSNTTKNPVVLNFSIGGVAP